ncbi:MAG: hypothetical protein DCC55_08595 [Chloroflexi bacterium]|nr:MAG: hypothetical protein DCC55_08595 [Chloroflexota bacterium]
MIKLWSRVLILLLSTLLLLAGCRSAQSPPPGVLAETPVATPAIPTAPPASDPPALAEDLSQAPPVQMALQLLRQQLQLGPEASEIVSLEPVDWPDQCLGISLPDRLCAPAITPGYRIIVRAEDREYEYRTDQEGSRIELAAAPEPALGSVAIVWRQVEDICAEAEIDAQQVAFGQCGGARMTVPLVSEMNRPQELAGFVQRYASFSADTPAGEITFTGQGTNPATPAEQRMIAEWVRQVALEAQAGRSGASWGLALAVHEEGAEPPLCRDVTVYVTGIAYTTSCLNDQPETLGSLRLDADQLGQVYTWLDTLRSFDVMTGEDPVRDLIFSGAGEGEASAADQEAMLALASEIYAQFDKSAPVAAPAVPTLVGDMKTFTNEEVGLAFDYPADWIIYGADIPGATITLASGERPGGGGVPAGMAKFDIVVRPAPGQTLAQIAAARKDELVTQGARLVAEEERILPSGLPVVWLQAESMGLSTLLVAEINAHEVLFVAFGDLEQFEAIVQTLRTQ